MQHVIVPLGSGNLGPLLDAAFPDWKTEDWKYREIAADGFECTTENSPGPWYAEYVVIVESIAQLRLLLPLFTTEGRAHNIGIIVENSAPGFISLVSSTLEESLSVRQGKIPGFSHAMFLELRAVHWLDIHGILSSLVLGLTTSDCIKIGVSDAAAAAWAIGNPSAGWIGNDYSFDDIDPVNSVDLAISSSSDEPSASPGAFSVAGASCVTAEVLELPPVDPVIYNPAGFDPYPAVAECELRHLGAGFGWVIGGMPVGARGEMDGQRFTVLGEAQVKFLRQFHLVRLDRGTDCSDWDFARMLSQLACAGIPVQFSRATPHVRDLLGPSVLEAVEAFGGATCRPIERESLSINSRRMALKSFLPEARLGHLRRKAGLGGRATPTVSVVLATRRPGMLPSILEQIAKQTWKEVETIVVLHGVDTVPASSRRAIESFPRPLLMLEAGGDVRFGDVLNLATRAACGEFVTKMDDDDWYGKHHLEDLYLAQKYSNAMLVGSPVEFAYVGGVDVTTRRNHRGEIFSDHVAGGTLWISRTQLLSLGGWRPVSSAVDRALIDAVRKSGGTVYRNHGQNYMMNRRTAQEGDLVHTWNADNSVFFRDCLEQWDGFEPAPQLDVNDLHRPIAGRLPAFTSWMGRTGR